MKNFRPGIMSSVEGQMEKALALCILHLRLLKNIVYIIYTVYIHLVKSLGFLYAISNHSHTIYYIHMLKANEKKRTITVHTKTSITPFKKPAF